MGKKVKYISALLSYVLIICLIMGTFPATTFAKSSTQMTEATKPTKKIVETTEAEKSQKQKTMQVTDVKTKKTQEVEIKEEPETETLPTTIQTTQTPITEVTTINSLAENQDTSETIPHHKKFCDETAEAHTGWKKINIQDGNLTDGNYYLDSDISLPFGPLQVKGDVTLCLNGHTVKNNTSGGSRVIEVHKGASLTLFDHSANQGTISGLLNPSLETRGGVYINGGTFIMNGGTIAGNMARGYNGGGVSVVNDGTFIMNNGTITNNRTSMYGGGVSVIDGTFTMNGGTISENKADNWEFGGGGVSVIDGTFTMNGGTISKNLGGFWGGGIFIYNSDVTINDGSIISYNTLQYGGDRPGGGGICVATNSTLTINDGNISNNESSGCGGGIFAYNSILNISNSTISNNKITKKYTFGGGGGICLEGSTLNMKDSSISNNEGYYGGGVYVNTSVFNMKNGTIMNNTTINNSLDYTGGGVYINQDSTSIFNISGSPIITNNTKDNSTNNVYLPKDKIINVVGELGEKANIGVTVEDLPTEENPLRKIAEDSNGYTILNDDKKKFTSDDPKYTTIFKDDAVHLGEAPDEKTVIFDYQYNEIKNVINVEVGKTVTEPDKPTREGHTFGGWYKEDTYENKWDFANDTVTKDMTLYAKWIPKQYTVTFNSQDGSPVDSQTIEHGNTVTKTADPTKTGYDFGGWYEEQECNTAWDFATPVTSNMTLYAKWIQNETPTPPEEKYTVTFDSKGGTGVSSQEVESGKTVTKPADPTKNGFTFDGWYKEQEYTTAWNFATPVTANMTLYAKWTKNGTPQPTEYNVNFDSKGGTGVSSQIVKANQKAAKPDPDPTREGYTFDGWYQNEDFSGGKWDFYNDIVTENIILYAKWTEETTVDPTPPAEVNYTITFDSQGGSDVPTQTVEKGKTVAKPAAPTKTSFTFAGWFTDKAYTQEYDFDTAVIADMTLFAKWEENKTTPSNPTLPTIKYYTVTFESNGGSAIPSQTISSGRTATMPQNPTKNDCEFLGWFVDKDFNEIYRFSTPITKDIIIYAKWKSDDCIVTFDSNGGSEIPIQIIEAGKTATMPENPTKSDYEFLGWFADKDFNEIYHFNTPIIEDITIYAKWKSKTRSSGGGGGGGHYRTGTWVTEEPEKQHQIVKLGCPRDETCPLWKFTDVDRWAWYHDGSHYCVEHGLIVGTTNTTFSPHIPITRAMVVAILWRIEDKPLVNDVITFQDVNESEYYAEAVRWAAHNGIVSGYSRTVFAPDDSITREQMASILYRYTQYKNRDVSGRADISNYEDKNEISNYALTAIQWACDVGIINGINATTLSPKGTTTRAQAAQMFKAYLEQL